MLLWVIIIALTGLAIFAVLWPLAHKRTWLLESAPSPDITFYEAQLGELARDEFRALISPQEAQQAKDEAGRRLLNAAKTPSSSLLQSPTQSLIASRVVAVCALIIIPVATFALYMKLGSPDFEDQPLKARMAQQHKIDPAQLSLDAALARVEKHVSQTPNDVRGWEVLAPIYLKAERYAEAVSAWENIMRLKGDTAENLASYGEALAFENQGVVSEQARKIFTKAHDKAKETLPENAFAYAKSRYWLGLAFEQEGSLPQAMNLYEELISAGQSAKNEPPTWLSLVIERRDALRDKLRPKKQDERP
jgi:cytochrome c-type biogenesis protein CcmH